MSEFKKFNAPTAILDDLAHLDHPFSAFLNTTAEYVKNDYAITVKFLKSYNGSEATFRSYRRELERLLQWSWFVKQVSIKQLTREDIEGFILFCKKPPKKWIGVKQVPRFIMDHDALRTPNPEWRPFMVSVSKKNRSNGEKPEKNAYQPSQSAIQAIFSILSSFYNYLVHEQYTPANPILQIRQKSKFIRKQSFKRPIRRLSDLQWHYVITTAEAMASKDPEKHQRTLFMMTALYGMYLRISELAANERWAPQMGHFFRDQNNNWWFKTVGKGNKERDISVSDAMLTALKRYRTYLGLPSLPAPNEQTPLIKKSKGMGPVTDTRHIRRIVQGCFDNAIEKLQQDKLVEEAEQLKSATVHWLRHTGISDDVKIRPREHVRDDAGHSSSLITDRYVDVELVARHQSARKKQIIPEL